MEKYLIVSDRTILYPWQNNKCSHCDCILQVLFKSTLEKVTCIFLVKLFLIGTCSAYEADYWFLVEALWLTNGSWWPIIDQKILPDCTQTRHFSRADTSYKAYHSSVLYSFTSKSGLVYFRILVKDWHYQNDTLRRWFLLLLGITD